MIYFDTSATTPLLPEVRDRMIELMNRSVAGELGNPSSLHTPGSRAKFELIRAREQVAQLIEARPLELIFTSGGSESNNTVVRTFENCPIFVSAIEHPSVLAPAEAFGKPCIKIPVDKQGIINLGFFKTNLEKLVKENPKQKILVSVQLANNEVGTIEPVKEIANIIKNIKQETKAKIYLHTDATQAVGKIPVSAKDLGVDYLTFTSHKLGGPVGIAALYVKTGAPMKPLIFGGAQENKRRAGTSNVLLASGFGVACEIAKDAIENYGKVKNVRDYLINEIKNKIETTIIITPQKSLPNVLNVSFPAAEGESTQLYLDLENIAVSTGSACASGDLEPSHVIMAMYHDAEIAHGSVRFSLGLNTSKQDIDELMTKLPNIVAKIQDLSTLNKETQNANK
ncbi:cysteine desulfurase [Candidatus Saccharibacteria bacterium]|nr:cysteine desulfurase [Candidatus Saccharibacteria bacterium]